jgi:hypothetical protein
MAPLSFHFKNMHGHQAATTESTEWKCKKPGNLQWHEVCTKFYENLSSGLPVDMTIKIGDFYALAFLPK